MMSTVKETFFLFKGSQVNTPIQHGRSPLHIAVQAGKLDVIKYLVSKGADVNVSRCMEFVCAHLKTQFQVLSNNTKRVFSVKSTASLKFDKKRYPTE